MRYLKLLSLYIKKAFVAFITPTGPFDFNDYMTPINDKIKQLKKVRY